jgi:MFS family permease
VKTALPLGPSEPRIPDERRGFWGALRFGDFRILWFGLLVSNLGTWMQFTALGYQVVHLAPSAHFAVLYVGFLGLARAVPALLFSPFAGVVADRYPRRRVLLMTNSMTVALALTLAIVIASGHGSILMLCLLSGAQAATQSFDAPARQSWVPLLVDKEYLSNAIGLNAIAFNTPAVIGPPVAGIVIASIGVAPCMFVNAAATLAVVTALLFMKPVAASAKHEGSVLSAIVAGVRFLATHPVLRWVVLLLIVSAFFVRPYTFLLPAYAAHVVHTDARGLGVLMAASGLGAICGAVATAAIIPRRRSILWAGSALLLALGTIVLATIDHIIPAFFVLVVMGFATMSFLGSSNILLQTLAPADMRGRAISVYAMILLGLVPGGSLVLGSIASVFDLRTAFLIGGTLTTACAIWIYAAHPKLREV